MWHGFLREAGSVEHVRCGRDWRLSFCKAPQQKGREERKIRQLDGPIILYKWYQASSRRGWLKLQLVTKKKQPEVLRAGPKNIQEERGSWHLAGKVVQSCIQTSGQTNKQANKQKRASSCCVKQNRCNTSHAHVLQQYYYCICGDNIKCLWKWFIIKDIRHRETCM